MSGNGVVMMQKFVEAHKLGDSESPQIFHEVYSLLHKKITRLKKIEELYSETGEKAPLTSCPHCGSKILLSSNCEFCGHFLMEEVIVADDEGNEIAPAVEEAPEEVQTTGRRGKPAPVTDTKPETVEEPVEAKEETTTDENVELPTEAEIDKWRRPGLQKLVDKHNLELETDIDKDDLKKIRIEIKSKLLGIEPEVKKKSRSATKAKNAEAPKEEVKEEAPAIDFSKAPSAEALEGMSEDQLLNTIKDFGLDLADTVKTLNKDSLTDDEFFGCVDAIIEGLKNAEEASKKPVEEPKEEKKTRAKRTPKAETKAEAPKGKPIKLDDLPEGSALENMDEKGLKEVITKFGLALDKESKELDGELTDDQFFAIVDAIDAKIEAIANAINAGEEPTYPVTEEAPKKGRSTRAKKEVSEAKLEEGNETDENYEDIDLDNADISYDDINIEDVNA